LSQDLYMLFKGRIWVGQRLYRGRKACMQSEGRFCAVGKGSIMVVQSLIVIGSQLIVQGRAKIMQGAVMVLCSREVAYGCESLLYGRTNHHYGLWTAWSWSKDRGWV